MNLIAGLLSHNGPYWIPGTGIIAVIALVIFYARGGRRAQNERAARNRE